MAHEEEILPSAFSEAKERRLVWFLCGLAAIRVFMFSAAFPFFNNVDEQQHFDLVIKYSSGHFPQGLERFSEQSSRYITTYGSPEYMLKPEQFPGGNYPPPLWKQSSEIIRPRLLAEFAYWQSSTNHETSQPPVYYTMAGLWTKLGQAAGLKGGDLLFWIRFMNAPMAGALVYLGFIAAKIIFPKQIFPRLATPTLLAFIPQDTFYSIQNDVLSPVCFGAAFICTLLWVRAEKPGLLLAAMTGLFLATACLVKTSNLPLVVVTGVVLLGDLRQRTRQNNLQKNLRAISILFLTFAVPTLLLLFWNKHAFGDFTGSAERIKALGWTHKSFRDWWPHPIFTLHGFWLFGSDLLTSYWRGEFVWQRKPLAWPATDIFYWLSSVVLFVIAIASLIRRMSELSAKSRHALWFGAACCFAAVAFLGLASISFDFGNCFYPSRNYPYVASGRLITGMMIPFALLYVFSLDALLFRFKFWQKATVLAGIILFMTTSEIAVSLPAFSSQYNWFHL